MIYLIIVRSAVFIPVVPVKKSPSVAMAAGVITGIFHLVPPAIALPLGYLPLSSSITHLGFDNLDCGRAVGTQSGQVKERLAAVAAEDFHHHVSLGDPALR